MRNNKEILKNFTAYIIENLDIKSNAKITFVEKIDETSPSFLQDWNSAGAYMPGTKEVFVRTSGRALADIMRTLAHELTHHKQNELQLISDTEFNQKLEDQANVFSGRLVRWFGQKHPEIY